MPFAPCDACGRQVVLDPTGRCPEGHHVEVASPEQAARNGTPEPTSATDAVDHADLVRELRALGGLGPTAATPQASAAPTGSAEPQARDAFDGLAAIEAALSDDGPAPAVPDSPPEPPRHAPAETESTGAGSTDGALTPPPTEPPPAAPPSISSFSARGSGGKRRRFGR